MRTFCRPLSPIELRNRGNRDPPSATAAATLPEKKAGFRARERFQACIHALPISHTSHLLAWWCGCHDDWGDQTELLLQYCAPFADLIFQKCSEPLSFLTFFKWKSSSRYSPVHILSTTFPDRAAETEILLRRPRQPLYPKKYRVSRPRVFSSLNSRVPDLSHFPTTCMMMWLPWWLRWWCGCHRGEKAIAMTIVRNSEVSKLNFLWTGFEWTQTYFYVFLFFTGSKVPWQYNLCVRCRWEFFSQHFWTHAVLWCIVICCLNLVSAGQAGLEGFAGRWYHPFLKQ